MSRRQFGAIRRLPSGRYQACYPGPGSGPACRRTAHLRAEGRCRSMAVDHRGRPGRGVWLDPKPAQGLTVAAWAERWLRSDPDKRPSTVARDQQAFDQFLPSLGA